MHHFNDALSHSYKVIEKFLDNKTHGILVGCAGSFAYLHATNRINETFLL